MRLPIGHSDFRKLIDQQFDFVDKSLLIESILKDDAESILITRPRRFGKTLNMSMLRYFFAPEVHGSSTEGLFNGLKITQADESVWQHHRKYPVIFLTFKDLKETTYEEAYEGFCKLIQDLYIEHSYLLNNEKIPNANRHIYRLILKREATRADISTSLRDLSHYLFLHHGVKPIILIDEYDTPIQSGYLNHYYEEIIVLFRHFLGAALKDNPYLFKAILTGILRVSRESLFSGLNNLRAYSVLNAGYSAYFGFTEAEVADLLKKSNLKTHTREIKNWYNGYQIGNEILYNPWSIVNCLQEGGMIKPYWVNTSDNGLIKELLLGSEVAFKERFADLMEGKAIEYLLNEHFIFADLTKKSEQAIWTLLLMAGYLKVVESQHTEQGVICQLMIPNREVRSVYRNIIEEWLAEGKDIVWYNTFIDHLLKGNMSLFEKNLTQILENTIGIHDVSLTPEAFYHGFMIGLTASLYSNPNYETSSNREAGYGRYDFMIFSRDPEKLTILFEFKKVDLPKSRKNTEISHKKLQKAAEQALSQIDQQTYYAEAKQRGAQQILKIGIAFAGKRFGMAYAL